MKVRKQPANGRCQDSRSKDKEMKKKNKEQNDIPAPA